MIDPETETIISLKAATKLRTFERDGKRPHVSTLWRWASAGKLETIRIGGQTYTSIAAIQRMLARDNPATIPTVSPRERARQIGVCERRLAAAGI